MPTEAVIKLGSQATVTLLFAYPNAEHGDQTLAQTIEHYFNDSMLREGAGPIDVSAQVAEALCTVTVTGADAAVVNQIALRYQAFFDIGQIGLQAAGVFRSSGKWNDEWQFFLPLGIPLAFARAIEVMDFPPVTLIGNQDYLHSKTTSRWWELLMLNGVSDAEKAQYSCILDIVPVAAPAGDGQKLELSGIYDGPFDCYDLPLLQSLVKSANGAGAPQANRPLIALGLPIRNWIERNWKLCLQVGQIGTITLKDGDLCNVIATNHPSLFFYVVHSFTGPDSGEKNLAAGLAVMKQDIVCAAWHAGMGRNPGSNPQEVLSAATAQWQNRDAELLALVKKQAGLVGGPVDVTHSDLEALVKMEPDAEQLKQLEKRFYADGAGHVV